LISFWFILFAKTVLYWSRDDQIKNKKTRPRDAVDILPLLLMMMMMMFSEEGNDDIKYNFLIDQDGVIYEGRGWGVVGQHTKGRDSHSIGSTLSSCISTSHNKRPRVPFSSPPGYIYGLLCLSFRFD